MANQPIREGSLEAPSRHSLDWQNPEFYDETALMQELERVFDICHGCRRCFSLCQAFPTLFVAIDESDTMELDGVRKEDYWNVVDHCYLCDMCFMTKCPYVPPHEWNLDFPHLMLRAKAVKFKKGEVKARDKLLTSTDMMGQLAGIPVVAEVMNRANESPALRSVLSKVLEVHPQAALPKFHRHALRQRVESDKSDQNEAKVVLFATCYGNRNEPQIGEDLVAVLRHNGVKVALADKEACCGMPKMELGDLDAVAKLKDKNIPELLPWVEKGWSIVAPVPSCVLMFKQELPLLFPDDEAVKKIAEAFYDPFEYLWSLHKQGTLNTMFKQSLGDVAYHAPCHLRVQNLGQRTRDVLQLVDDTKVHLIERCSGHDGTYAVKNEFHDASMKIAKPVVNKVKQIQAEYYGSDCPMAGQHIAHGLKDDSTPLHPMSMLRKAYGI